MTVVCSPLLLLPLLLQRHEDLAKIRAARLQQLQSQSSPSGGIGGVGGGGGGGGSDEQYTPSPAPTHTRRNTLTRKVGHKKVPPTLHQPLTDAQLTPMTRTAAAESRKNLISQICTPEAVDRLGRIALVKASRAQDLEKQLIALARSNQLRERVTDQELVRLIGLVDQSRSQAAGGGGGGGGSGDGDSKIVFQRRRAMFDDEDDDLFD